MQTQSVLDKIDAACEDVDDAFQEGEYPPSKKAVSDLKTLLLEAIQQGAVWGEEYVSSYFGELSVTWRTDSRMLRATSFSDARSPRLDYGTTPAGALGKYEFTLDADGSDLLDKLAWLNSEV